MSDSMFVFLGSVVAASPGLVLFAAIVFRKMPIGTKSVLFGAHCFFIHPVLLFVSWWRLYGFPWDPRLWVAFVVHDLGYWGKPNMDGEEGELHPYLGAKVMGFLFDKKKPDNKSYPLPSEYWYWHDFTLYHSRFLAKKNGAQFSRLCVADKYVIATEPAWLYLPRVRFTGEIKEYMKDAAKNSNGDIPVQESESAWYAAVQKYVLGWVQEHKDCRPDTWTPASREANDGTGVWK